MESQRGIIAVFAIVLSVLIFWQPRADDPFQSLFSGHFSSGENASSELEVQNVALEAKLAILHDFESKISQVDYEGVAAHVYSRYLFSLKNELLIDAGSAQGIALHEPAVISVSRYLDSASSSFAQVLLGRVSYLAEHYAIIQTVFDVEFQSAVRIGEGGTNAILEGGTEPKLTLIPKTAKVNEGDIVYSASQEFPYGIAVGRIKNVRVSADALFQEAGITFPFDIDSVSIVSVLNYVPPRIPLGFSLSRLVSCVRPFYCKLVSHYFLVFTLVFFSPFFLLYRFLEMPCLSFFYLYSRSIS